MLDIDSPKLPGASAPSASRRRWRFSRAMLPLSLLAASVLLAVAVLAINWASSGDDMGMVFVIPAGASDSVDIPTIDSAIAIPTDIQFGPGDVARITVRNEDSVANRAGPWVIGPGQTYTARFDEPGEYKFDCTVDETESVVVTVLN